MRGLRDFDPHPPPRHTNRRGGPAGAECALLLMSKRVAPKRPYWHVSEDEWYDSVLNHWTSHVSADTDDGVLGGYGAIDELDAAASLGFASHWGGRKEGGFATGSRALDCGAGIGRVSAGVLAHICENVDLVEVSQPLLDQAEKNLEHIPCNRVRFIKESLRTFEPECVSYDVIWLQWVLGHLTDRDVLALLIRCRHGLRAGGVVVVKDNNALPKECIAGRGRYALDEDNAAVIRSYAHMRSLFRQAGLKLEHVERQTDFPEELCTPQPQSLHPPAP